MQDRIRNLIQQVQSLVDSDENRRRQDVQRHLGQREVVFPTPINSWDITTTFPMMVQEWCRRLDWKLDLEKIGKATGPLTPDFAAELVEFQLLQKIYKFENVPDDLPLSLGINTNLGLCWMYRKGPLGEHYLIEEDTGAFVPVPILKTEADFDKLEMPRFSFDETLHKERVAVYTEIVEGHLPVGDDAMPGGIGAPFSTANNLRGVLEILEDMQERPHLVHRLMEFIADAILSLNQQIQEARGGIRMGTLGCDEVSCDMFSPAAYEEFVFPYECKVAPSFHSLYYHSCGNLTPLYKKIVQIPNVHRVHVSPWSNLEAAIRDAGGKVILEKHLDPTVEWDRLSREEVRVHVRQITDLGLDYPLDLVVETARPGGRLFREVFYEEIGA
jgi:hypothetical protein